MVDHEIDLRPVLRGLWQVVDICVFPCATGDRGLVILGQQALVDAHRRDPCLHRLFVERVDKFFVVQPPGYFVVCGLSGSPMVYPFQLLGFTSAIQRSTSSSHPGCAGVNSEWNNRRLEPAMLLTVWCATFI